MTVLVVLIYRVLKDSQCTKNGHIHVMRFSTLLMIKDALNNECYLGGREMGRFIHGSWECGLVYIVYSGWLYYFCSDKKGKLYKKQKQDKLYLNKAVVSK